MASGPCHKSAERGALTTIDFGVTATDFRERLFEKECWLARAALPAEFRLGLPDIEEVLRSVEPVSPHLQLFDRGRISEGEFTQWTMTDNLPRRCLDGRFRALLASGATLILNSLDAHCASAARLGEEVSRFAGFPTCSNAYVSFGGNGSFGAHWDTHDVVVLQLVGRKRWRVGPPTFPLPLPGQTSRRSGEAAPPPWTLDVRLEPGDLLYLPRGWWHEVTPLPEPSLHLSVGIYVPSVFDALGLLCQQMLPLELAARRGAIDEAATSRDLASLVDVLRSALADRALMTRLRGELAVPRAQAREF
ncbi:MAG TPA: cupin domain-containing protein [Steroidobacteraceae bacterium]|nr:cupin domain-containing protein [Steroidobacteraceae bacterium]